VCTGNPSTASRPKLRGGRGLAADVLLVIAIHAFAGWVYIAANAVSHPESLQWPLTHFASWPHEDTFGALCFAASLIASLSRAKIRNPR
jgi:hypothetical protein